MKPSKYLITAFSCLCLCLILLVSAPGLNCAKANTLRNFAHGDKIFSFSLPSLKDFSKKVTYDPDKAKPTALLFFSISPDFRKKRSLALLSELAGLNEQYKGKVDIIGIFSDDEKTETVKDFIKDKSLKLKVAQDSVKDVYNKLGVFMMPLVVLVDGNGALHEVIPYTFNIREHIDANLKLMTGEWTKEQFQEFLQPEENESKSEEEKEYIRRINYGRVMLSRKMYNQALREFKTAIKLQPDTVEGYIELGFTHLSLEEWQDAEKTFQKVLELEPESDDGVAGLGLALYKQGKTDQALQQLENAFIAPNPKLEVILALAEIYEAKGNMTKAVRLNKLAVAKLMKMYEHKWNKK